MKRIVMIVALATLSTGFAASAKAPNQASTRHVPHVAVDRSTTTTTTTTTAPPPTTTTTLAPLTFTPKCPEALSTARKVGWPTELLERLDATIWRESRCDIFAWNKYDPGTGSRGLTQINSYWCNQNTYNPYPGGYLGHRGVLNTCDDLFNPETNLTAALHLCWYSIQRHGHCWHPWKL